MHRTRHCFLLALLPLFLVDAQTTAFDDEISGATNTGVSLADAADPSSSVTDAESQTLNDVDAVTLDALAPEDNDDGLSLTTTGPFSSNTLLQSEVTSLIDTSELAAATGVTTGASELGSSINDPTSPSTITAFASSLETGSPTSSYTGPLCGECEGACAPQETSSPKSKRRRLTKRTFDDPTSYRGGFGQYMIDYADGVHPVNFVPKHFGEWNDLDNLPTAKWTKLEDEAFNMMLKGLYGCSSMIVVSRLGVYINHLWEYPSFVYPDRFESDVKGMVSSGDPSRSDMPGLAALRRDGQPFATENTEPLTALPDGNRVKTFLLVPRDQVLRYPEQTRYLESLLRLLFPGVEPVVVPYFPHHPSQVDYENSPLGKLLFQYDPKASVQRKRYIVGGKAVECPVQMAGLRLYLNDGSTPLYEDTWQSPYGSFGQTLGRREVNRRQESSVPAECQYIAEAASAATTSTEGPSPVTTEPGEGTASFGTSEASSSGIPDCDDYCIECEDSGDAHALSKRHPISKSLVKRELENPSDYPGGGYGQYMIDFADEKLEKAEFVPHGKEGASTALVTELLDKRVDVVLKGLRGCTSMVIISRFGIYINHLWERRAFVDQDGWKPLVLDVLPYGNPDRSDMPGLVDLFGEGGPFEKDSEDPWTADNKIQTFLITPNPDPRYEHRVEELEDLLQKLVPEVEPRVVRYTKAPKDFDYSTSALGKVLFQYDPKQETRQEVKIRSGRRYECTVAYSALRFFVMGNEQPVYEDVWESSSTGSTSSKGKRQESEEDAACRLITDEESIGTTDVDVVASALSTATSQSSTIAAVQAETTETDGTPSTLSTVAFEASVTRAPARTTGLATSARETTLSKYTSCAVVTRSATTSGSETVSESVGCSCNSPQQARLGSTVDDDGYTIYECAVGSSTTLAASTQPPEITSCALSTEPLTTIAGQEYPETEVCRCNAAWTAGVDMSVGPDSTTSWVCAVQTSPPIVVKTEDPPPPPPYQTGTCNVHILEVARGGDFPVFVQLNLTDGGGTLLTSQEQEIDFGDSHTIAVEDSELPWDVEVTLADSAPTKWQGYQNFPVELQAGDSEWSSEDTDLSTLPHCDVGGWDNGGFGDFVKDALSLGTMGNAPTRQMDCRFAC